jgi:hypothetical protein
MFVGIMGLKRDTSRRRRGVLRVAEVRGKSWSMLEHGSNV